MAINLETDDLIPVGQLLKQRLGTRKSPATVWRHRLKGINGARLECVLCGGCWMTTVGAFAEWVRQQTANCQSAPLGNDAPAERTAATTKKLAAAGLLLS